MLTWGLHSDRTQSFREQEKVVLSVCQLGMFCVFPVKLLKPTWWVPFTCKSSTWVRKGENTTNDQGAAQSDDVPSAVAPQLRAMLVVYILVLHFIYFGCYLERNNFSWYVAPLSIKNNLMWEVRRWELSFLGNRSPEVVKANVSNNWATALTFTNTKSIVTEVGPPSAENQQVWGAEWCACKSRADTRRTASLLDCPNELCIQTLHLCHRINASLLFSLREFLCQINRNNIS